MQWKTGGGILGGRTEKGGLQAGDRTELPETVGGVPLYMRPFIRAKFGEDEGLLAAL